MLPFNTPDVQRDMLVEASCCGRGNWWELTGWWVKLISVQNWKTSFEALRGLRQESKDLVWCWCWTERELFWKEVRLNISAVYNGGKDLPQKCSSNCGAIQSINSRELNKYADTPSRWSNLLKTMLLSLRNYTLPHKISIKSIQRFVDLSWCNMEKIKGHE